MNTFDHDSRPAATDWPIGRDDRPAPTSQDVGPRPDPVQTSDEKKSFVSGLEQLSRLEPNLVLEVSTNGHGGDSTRGFRAMDGIIEALGALGAALVPGIACHIENLALIENVGTHTVVGLLRYSVAQREPLRKNAVTAYLGRGIVEGVNWLNQLDCDDPLPLARMVQRLAAVAAEAGLSGCGFENPNSLALVKAIQGLNQARCDLAPPDSVSLSINGTVTRLVVGSNLAAEDIESAAAIWRIQNEGELLLVVETPDYTRTGRWGFLHDGRTIKAAIADRDWLSLFHRRTVDVRPGDVVRGLASTLSLYGARGELISSRYSIKAVLEFVQMDLVVSRR